ncbi:RNA polymerase II elongation factor ELL isoform X2 [Scyliorhinus canicula]|uniref:RNA polymerase II elongation factor ELL isoform X2 n=1 Tax=Scyliorhinus canicula TaxID=7830 RepID=UPI0018F74445|nr:RNA polymerase II elongation factor ELL isoform X2 [Scyliorhinus canicula]
MAAAAALSEERRFDLSCEKLNSGARLSLFHVKLTDTALRALEAYRRLAASTPNQPIICFQGNQGYIKIPAPNSDCHDGARCFSFYLSTDSKDKPQASFDCIQQYVSSFERDQLDCLGSIQDKITVCATDDSYKMTRERMSQVEKESWSRTTIEIKPESSCQGLRKSVHSRKQAASQAADGIPLRKHSPTMNPCFGMKKTYANTVTQRALKDRVIHLLALKPYKKPELILWLEREKANPKDKADLSFVLDQVAKLNAKDNSYTLKDELYKEIQQDWPGYSDEEKQLIQRHLIRKRRLSHSSQTKNFQLRSPFQKSSGETSPQSSPVKNSLLKRPVPSEQTDSHTSKRSKVLQSKNHSHPVLNGHLPHSACLTATANSCLTVKTEFEKTRTSLLVCQNELNEPFKKCSNSTKSDSNRNDKEFKGSRDITGSPRNRGAQASFEQTAYPHAEDLELSASHIRKKSKKHKEKAREHARPEARTWIKENPIQRVGKRDEDDVEEHETTNTSATASSTVEMPDYLLKYTAITSLELCQNYRNDFNAEYSEYRDLHARIGNITQQFMQLGSKIKTLIPGTKEHKMLEDQIFEEYRKFKKTHPMYQEEKVRCEYLHRKLAHIKQLIREYDPNQMS